jgi:hypothetical protein
MTSSKHAVTDWPVPLKAKEHGLGKAVREFVSATEETHDEPAAYARLDARLTSRPLVRHGPRLAVGLALVVLASIAGMAVYRRALHRHGPGIAAAPKARSESRAPSRTSNQLPALPPPKLQVPASARTVSIRLASAPVALPPGQIDLAGQATVVLAADAVASGRSQAGNTEIEIKKGKIDLDVLPRSRGQGFSVRAEGYRFAVVGTAFTVSQSRSRIELQVREGTVAVWRSETRVATVHAGQTWSADLPSGRRPSARSETAELTTSSFVQPSPVTAEAPATPPVLAPPPVPSPMEPWPAIPRPDELPAAAASPKPAPKASGAAATACGDLLAQKQPREALACYQERAKQNGLAGETAEYELARLWRDSLGDLQRALAAFQEQRARFPGGALRIEADLSIIEILPRLGRHAEALAESERFLVSHPTSERRGEIHLLRGNLFREGVHDLRQAEREYALGARSGGRTGDDCRFLHAVSLEALGRTKEARSEYREYLLRRGAAHTSEAKKRLDSLPP